MGTSVTKIWNGFENYLTFGRILLNFSTRMQSIKVRVLVMNAPVVLPSFLLTLMLIPNYATADCEDLIRLSRLSNTLSTSEAAFSEASSSFCKEYAQQKSSGSSASIGASYKLLSFDASGSTLTDEQIASKYCGAENSIQSNSSGFAQYVETIAPGAYDSYNKCKAAQSYMTASLSDASVLAKRLTIIVSNKNSSSSSKDSFQVSYPSTIQCSWKESKVAEVDGDVVTLPASSSAALDCTRDNEADAAFVTLAAITTPNSGFTFPWRAYQNGLPIDQLLEIKNANMAVVNALSKSVIAFRGSSCPPGWMAVSDTAGRVIVGAGSGANLKPRTPEERGGEEEHILSLEEMPSHNHGIALNLKWGNGFMPGGAGWASDNVTQAEATIMTNKVGGGKPHQNMPPFIVMQFCQLNRS